MIIIILGIVISVFVIGQCIGIDNTPDPYYCPASWESKENK